MATNSTICFYNTNKTVTQISVNYGGYATLQTLREFYNSIAKAKALVALGNLQVLCDSLETSVSYVRDKQGDAAEDGAVTYASMRDLVMHGNSSSYDYVYINNKWRALTYYINNCNKF